MGDLAADRAAALTAHLRAAAATTFAWGSADCCLFAADWVRTRTGVDPCGDWRGAYADEAEARRRLAERGGLDVVLAAGARRAALSETTEPGDGDVGLVKHAGRRVAAIHTSHGWAMRTLRGLRIGPAGLVVAWIVP